LLLLMPWEGLAQPVAAQPWVNWQPPPIALPTPNGFDTYLQAFALKDELDVRYHVPKPKLVFPSKPATSPAPADGSPESPSKDPWGVGPPDKPIAERVRLYARVYELARKALAQDCVIPFPTSNDAPNAYLSQFRAMSRLFRMEAHWHVQNRRYAAAAASATDCIEMAQDVASEGWLLPYLTSTACESIGMQALDEAVGEISASECAAALVRLQRIDAMRRPMTDILTGNEAFARVAFKEVMAAPEKLRDFFDTDDGEPMSDGALRLLRDEFMPRSWSRLGPLYGRLRAEWAKPYRDRSYEFIPSGDLSDLFLIIVAPHAQHIWFLDSRIRTAAALRELQLAARGHALERGDLPHALKDLVPTWVSEIPADPFGTEPIRSTRSPQSLLIYSVGPDGVDDNGRAVEGPLREEARGDIVVKIPSV